jgi:RNA polymerase-binding transcription factor DksA
MTLRIVSEDPQARAGLGAVEKTLTDLTSYVEGVIDDGAQEAALMNERLDLLKIAGNAHNAAIEKLNTFSEKAATQVEALKADLKAAKEASGSSLSDHQFMNQFAEQMNNNDKELALVNREQRLNKVALDTLEKMIKGAGGFSPEFQRLQNDYLELNIAHQVLIKNVLVLEKEKADLKAWANSADFTIGRLNERLSALEKKRKPTADKPRAPRKAVKK